MVQLNFGTMEKIKLVKALWRNEPGEVIEVSTIRAEFAKRKGYAVEHVEEKAENKEYENKAIRKPKKNK